MSAERSAAEAAAPLATCRFAFDEAAFREYYELRFRPHDRPSGWKFMWLGLVALAPVGAFLAFLAWPDGAVTKVPFYEKPRPRIWGLGFSAFARRSMKEKDGQKRR